MKKSKLNKIKEIERPWIEYYNDKSKANIAYPEGNLMDVLEETADKYPNYYAYQFFNKNVTYSTLVSKIKSVAAALVAHGVKKGDKVTICMPNTPEGIASVYAVNMIGAIGNMIHPLSSINEIETYLNISESKFVITIDLVLDKFVELYSTSKLEKVIYVSPSEDMSKVMQSLYYIKSGRKVKAPKNNPNIISWKKFMSSRRVFDESFRANTTKDDPALILYSGGTTGKPKGILLSNLNLNSVARGSEMMTDPAKAGDSVLSILPIFHGFGLVVCIHTPLSIGMKCILIPAFKPKEFVSLIKKYKPNFLAGVPALYESLLSSNFGEKDLECVTCVISGGDLLTSEVKTKVDAYLEAHGSKAKVRQGYGLTEGTGASCLTPTHIYKPGTIGIPYPDTYYKIVKMETHDEAPLGTDGEICISGPMVMMGYYNDEAETAQVLRIHEDGRIWLHTGDIGSMDEKGFVFFKQRIKRLIVSSGYNIYPSYIENVLNSHPNVLTSTVIGIDHPRKGQVAKAFIILKDGTELNDELKKDIKEHCEKNVSKFSLPYEYEFRESFPKTLVGKVAYRELEEEEKNKNK